MAGVPLPVVALALAGGAIVVVYGTRSVKDAFASSPSSPGSPSSPSSPSSPTGTGGDLLDPAGETVTAAVNSVAGEHGWDASEIADWIAVLVKESGLSASDLTLTNASGGVNGAYGLAQADTGTLAGNIAWYTQYGGNANTIIGQITAMANYIEQRYGTPSAALAHENEFSWY